MFIKLFTSFNCYCLLSLSHVVVELGLYQDDKNADRKGKSFYIERTIMNSTQYQAI